MELKEVVNLRKLREYYDSTLPDEFCNQCPMRSACKDYSRKPELYECLIEMMLGIVGDHRDLYDLERDGELTPDYQI